jgi:HSP20 family protein
VVDVEVLGVAKEDSSVELSGRHLVVAGAQGARTDGVLRHKTRSVGQFRYDLLLPGEVEEKKVEATLADGVLTVRAPKAATERSRRITII